MTVFICHPQLLSLATELTPPLHRNIPSSSSSYVSHSCCCSPFTVHRSPLFLGLGLGVRTVIISYGMQCSTVLNGLFGFLIHVRLDIFPIPTHLHLHSIPQTGGTISLAPFTCISSLQSYPPPPPVYPLPVACYPLPVCPLARRKTNPPNAVSRPVWDFAFLPSGSGGAFLCSALRVVYPRPRWRAVLQG